jgi:hypothetical protein
MLVLYSFRIGMAIIAYFNLKVKQYNVINVFIYALKQLDRPTITCYILDGFPILEMLIKVKQALYSLINSPLL